MRSRVGAGLILLGVWLIVTGLVALLNLTVAGLGLLLAVLAILAGLLILIGWGRKRVRYPSEVGLLLLAVWLILVGIVSLLGASLPGLGLVLDLLALVAGVLLLFGLRSPSPAGRVGMAFLALWLILSSLMSLLGASFPGSGVLLALLALVAGFLILLTR